MELMESVAAEFIRLYDISAPPIPIEKMLQSPRPTMWEEVNIAALTARLDLSSPYSAQMSMARLLARNIFESRWGIEHGLAGLENDDSTVRRFGRMLAMPAHMVMQLNKNARTPLLLSLHFEVPEAEAVLRLQEVEGA